MDDVPPSVAIVFIICVTIIVAVITVCDCVKQKSATTDSAATPTVSSTGVDDTPTETTNAPTDTPTLTEEQARRAGAALMMRAATHAATGF